MKDRFLGHKSQIGGGTLRGFVTDIFFNYSSATSVAPGTLTCFFWGKDSQSSVMFEETCDAGDWVTLETSAKWIAHLGGLEDFYMDMDKTGEWHVEILNSGAQDIVHSGATTTCHVAFNWRPEVGG